MAWRGPLPPGEPLEGRPFVHHRVFDAQPVHVERRVFAQRRCSAFATADLSTLWICFAASFFENRRMAYACARPGPDLVDHEAHLPRRLAHGPLDRSRFHDLCRLGRCFGSGRGASSRSCAEPLAECRGTAACRELAQLVPHHVLGDVHRDELVTVVHREGVATKSGVMVERRDQVLNTFFSFFSFRAVIFTRSDGSTYALLDRASITVSPSALASAHDQFRRRLLLVPVFFPRPCPGIRRGRPPEVFPRRAQRWSTGSSPRRAPADCGQPAALPLSDREQLVLGLPTSPIWRALARTIRISVERRRSVT